MYSALYKSILFPLYESILRGRNTLKYLKELEANQWLSGEQIKEMQMQKLHALLEHSYNNVPCYRKRFDELGMTPDDIETLDDFRQFPMLSKMDIKRDGSSLLAKNYKTTDVVMDSTGGSTGVLVEFMYPRESYEQRVAAAARGDSWAGWDFAKKETVIWGRHIGGEPYRLRLKKSLHHLIIRRQYICSYSFSIGSFPMYIKRINRFKPDVIVSYVTPLYNLAKYIKQKNVKCYSPKGIITSAEKLFEHQRQLIESVFQTQVFNRYGCTETGLIAAECSEHNGLHINADNLIVEFIRDGKPVQPGEVGEIVVTSLHNYLMPFIRYRLGDTGRPSADKCRCGRGLPLMQDIEGRVVDTIVTPDGRYVPGQFFQYILDIAKGIDQFQVIQKTLDQLTVYLVTNSDFEMSCLDRFQRETRRVMGEEIYIRFEFVDNIPLPRSGKYRYTISEVPVDFGNAN
jgi:phenylacetate-CoA ligase